MSTKPEVTRLGIIDMQVCVPSDMADDEVIRFAEGSNPCGTQTGWRIRRQGDPALLWAAERMPCQKRPGYVHLMLDA